MRLHALPDRILGSSTRIFYLFYISLLFPLSAMSQDLSLSPLEACPDTPNCVHEGRNFQLLPSDLRDHVVAVLKDMKAESIDLGLVDSHAIHAVFKIWRYRDDLHIAIVLENSGTTLFIRSASREGHSDLGVNKRRVKKFFRKLNTSLQASQ